MPRPGRGTPVINPNLGSGDTEKSRAEVRQYLQPRMMPTRPVRPVKTAAERKKDEEKKKKKKDLKIAKKR